MKRKLPYYGLKVKGIPCIEVVEEVIGASKVWTAWKERDLDQLKGDHRTLQNLQSQNKDFRFQLSLMIRYYLLKVKKELRE